MGTSVTSILENPQERSGAPLGQVCRADWLIPGSRQTEHQTAADLDENADSPAGVSEFVPHTPNLRHVVQKYRIL